MFLGDIHGSFNIFHQYVKIYGIKDTHIIQVGDFGLYSCKIKSRNVAQSFDYFKANGAKMIGELFTLPNGKNSFFCEDPNGNIFQVVEGRGYFSKTGFPSLCGGVAGSIIGVSNIEKALPLYRDILGYTAIEYDVTGTFEDLAVLLVFYELLPFVASILLPARRVGLIL
jgi:catechol 2,3-dioxygenase-like lactoylglutathione lyase family enzyme